MFAQKFVHCLNAIPTLLLISASVSGQNASSDRALNNERSQPEPPVVHLEYGEPIRSTVLKANGMYMAFPFRCSSDGAVVFLAYIPSTPPAKNVGFTVLSVKPSGDSLDVVRFDPNLVPGFQSILPASYALAVSDSKVVFVVWAVTAEEAAKDSQAKPHPFLLSFNRDGHFLRAAPLDLPFAIGGIGLFDSGEILVAGNPLGNDRHEQWVVVDDRGNIQRNLTPAQDGDEKQLESGSTAYFQAVNGGQGQQQLIPYRGHLLLLQMNTTRSVVEINDGGVVKSTALKLPQGETPLEIIPSNGTTWTVVLAHVDTEGPKLPNGSPVGRMTPDRIAEFDPDTGGLLRYVDSGAGHWPTSLACEQNGAFLALSMDEKNGDLLVRRATVGK